MPGLQQSIAAVSGGLLMSKLEENGEDPGPALGGFEALMDVVCPGLGFCGATNRRGTPMHVTHIIPAAGPVTADQFVEWVFLADGMNPNVKPEKWRPLKDAIRAAFVEHMCGELADAKALRWSGCD
jgi:hypothetical protein